MYNFTSELVKNTYLNSIKQPSREITPRVYIGGVYFGPEHIIEIKVVNSFPNNLVTVGAAPSAKLTIKLANSDQLPSSFTGIPIEPAFLTGGTLIKVGKFYPTLGDIKTTDDAVVIECFDKMAELNDIDYTTNRTSWPAPLEVLLEELDGNIGVTLTPGYDSPYVQIPREHDGKVRNFLGDAATLSGGFSIFRGDGTLDIKIIEDTGFTLGPENYFKFELTSQSPFKISQLIAKSNQDGVEDFTYGTSDGIAIQVDNQFIQSQTEMNTYVKGQNYFPFESSGFTLECQGMPHLEIGDKITLTDTKGVVRDLYIGSHTISFKGGGLKSIIKLTAPEGKVSSFVGSGLTKLISETIKANQGDIDAAISNATDLITGNSGGFVVIKTDQNDKPQELLVMNTDNIDTATKVWRWNQSGLAYSSNGYNGTYSTAITADGAIVADFITTGTLSASLITTGTLQADLITIGSTTTFENGYDPTEISSSFQTDIDSLNSSVTALETESAEVASDDSISPFEKTQLKIRQQDMASENNKLVAHATSYAVSTTNYTTYYNALNNQLNSILADMTTSTNLVGIGDSIATRITNYENAKNDLVIAVQNKIDANAKPNSWKPDYDLDVIGTKPPTNADSTETAIENGIVTTGRIDIKNDSNLITAGVKGGGNVRFWAGSSSPQSGKFIVEDDGTVWSDGGMFKNGTFGAFTWYSGGAASGISRYSGAMTGLIADAVIGRSKVENIYGTFNELKGNNLEVDKITINQKITSDQLDIKTKHHSGTLDASESVTIQLNSMAFVPSIIGEVSAQLMLGGIKIKNETGKSQEYVVTYNYLNEGE